MFLIRVQYSKIPRRKPRDKQGFKTNHSSTDWCKIHSRRNTATQIGSVKERIAPQVSAFRLQWKEGIYRPDVNCVVINQLKDVLKILTPVIYLEDWCELKNEWIAGNQVAK